MPLSCVICFQLDGIYLGATKTKYMRDMMIVSFLVYSLAIVFLPKVWFNHGLWLALHIFMLARGLTLLINYKKIELK
jgi:MATE family multidrug resistance protein